MPIPTTFAELAELFVAEAPLRNAKRRTELAGIPGPALKAIAAAIDLYASQGAGELPALPSNADVTADDAARTMTFDQLREARLANGQLDRVSDRRARDLGDKLDQAFGPVQQAPKGPMPLTPLELIDALDLTVDEAVPDDSPGPLAAEIDEVGAALFHLSFRVTPPRLDDEDVPDAPPATQLGDPGGPLRPGEPAADGHYAPGLPDVYPGKGDAVESDGDGGDYRTYRSVSQLQKFGECGLAFKLRYVDRHPDVPAIWSLAGEAFHDMARRFESERLAGDAAPWSPDDAARAFTELFDARLDKARMHRPDLPLDDYRKANRGREDRSWWFDKGPSMAADYVKAALASARRPLQTDDGVLGLELDLRGQLGSLPVRGILDQLAVDHVARRLLIIDYKTGSHTPNDPAQLVTYGHLVDQVLPTLAPELASYSLFGAYHDARRGTLVNMADLRLGARRAANVERFAAFDAAERAGHYIANPSSFCGACSVRAHCPIMGNADPSFEP